MTSDEQLEALITAVTNSAKYRHISRDFIARVGKRELAARRNLKTAVKATKNKLHQVGGAYFDSQVDYAKALSRLRQSAHDPDLFRDTCKDLMRFHASTRERLPILESFYQSVFAGLPPIQSVMDIACGLHPLAWPWLPFDETVTVIAYDIYADLIEFVRQFMALAGIQGEAEVRDVISAPPQRPVDLVMMLKTLPVLAQIERTAVSRLLDSLQTSYLLVTFPVHSLGGRQKGMAQNYEAQFQAWAEGRNWAVQRFEFASELAFLVTVTEM